jgi:hypothetical protein
LNDLGTMPWNHLRARSVRATGTAGLP